MDNTCVWLAAASVTAALVLGGCSSLNSGNDGQLQSYPAPLIEADLPGHNTPVSLGTVPSVRSLVTLVAAPTFPRMI